MTDKREMMHGVRQYDNETGRFLSVESLWEKYISLSPYHYCMNNPVSTVDVNGKDLKVVFRALGTYSIFDPGHIAIAVVVPDPKNYTLGLDIKSSWSFTPRNNGVSLYAAITGTESRQANIEADIKDATIVLDIKTDSKFDNILSGLIEARTQENELYKLFANNCAITLIQLFNSALNIYGIDFQLPVPIRAGSALEVLQKEKKNIEKAITDKSSK